MKVRTLILTTGAAFALVVPAAQAATTSNRLFETRVQTVMWDKTHQTVGKSRASKSHATKSLGIVHKRFIPAAPSAPATTTPVASYPSPAAGNDAPNNVYFAPSNGSVPEGSAAMVKALTNAPAATPPVAASVTTAQAAPAPVANSSQGQSYWQRN